MRLSGRNLFVLAIVVVVALFSFVLFTARESPSIVAAQFMNALASGDVDTLTKLSATQRSTKDELRKEWTFATKVAAPHYILVWRIQRELVADDKNAAVSLGVTRDALSRGSFEENFDLPLIKENGKWRVVAEGINAEMYPALPR